VKGDTLHVLERVWTFGADSTWAASRRIDGRGEPITFSGYQIGEKKINGGFVLQGDVLSLSDNALQGVAHNLRPVAVTGVNAIESTPPGGQASPGAPCRPVGGGHRPAVLCMNHF